MKKLLLVFILFPIFVYSQTKTISGTVNDENNIPLVGVNISVENSNIGALTDFDGNYLITIPSDKPKVLIFSYLGYSTQEIDASSTENISIMMLPDLEQLEEVVVIGYGSVLKKDLTGSLSSVKVEEEVANQSNSIDQLLQGRAAGVQVVQNGANPGSGISVKIRGTNSLRGNNEPLYVVDGVIISSAGEDVLPAGVGNLGQESQNGLNGINPRDIESIQVLKDASATAIYGSRGANGVVVITTKKGKSGKLNIQSFSNTSVRVMTKQYDVLDPYGFATYANEINNNNGLAPRYFIDDDYTIYGINDDGSIASDNQIAELEIKGPSSALSYWNKPEKSKVTFNAEWTRTGDKYIRDTRGIYTYCGRADDMMKVSGQYVSPFEVEAALQTHDEVLEAAVVAKKDKDNLIKPKAFIILKNHCNDEEILKTKLTNHVKKQLTPFKYPRWYEFVEVLPKTATGKIQRYKLRNNDD